MSEREAKVAEIEAGLTEDERKLADEVCEMSAAIDDVLVDHEMGVCLHALYLVMGRVISFAPFEVRMSIMAEFVGDVMGAAKRFAELRGAEGEPSVELIHVVRVPGVSGVDGSGVDGEEPVDLQGFS